MQVEIICGNESSVLDWTAVPLPCPLAHWVNKSGIWLMWSFILDPMLALKWRPKGCTGRTITGITLKLVTMSQYLLQRRTRSDIYTHFTKSNDIVLKKDFSECYCKSARLHTCEMSRSNLVHLWVGWGCEGGVDDTQRAKGFQS